MNVRRVLLIGRPAKKIEFITNLSQRMHDAYVAESLAELEEHDTFTCINDSGTNYQVNRMEIPQRIIEQGIHPETVREALADVKIYNTDTVIFLNPTTETKSAFWNSFHELHPDIQVVEYDGSDALSFLTRLDRLPALTRPQQHSGMLFQPLSSEVRAPYNNNNLANKTAAPVATPLPIAVPAAAIADDINPAVTEKLRQVKASDTLLIFPGEAVLQTPLTVVDTKYYLDKLQDKLTLQKRKLDVLVLDCCDENTLDALLASVKIDQTSCFNEIRLEIAAGVNSVEFMKKLQLVMLVLSKTALASLVLQDAHQQIQEDGWEQYANFIVVNKIAVDCTLPEAYQSGNHQRKIDNAVEISIRDRACEAAQQQTEKSIQARIIADEKALERPRKRQQSDPQADMEFEQEQEEEQEQEQEQQHQAEIQADQTDQSGKDDLADLDVIDFQTFYQWVSTKDFKDIPERSYLLAIAELKSIWNIWFGHLENHEHKQSLQPRIMGASRAACAHLLLFADHFKLGIDYDHLPPGFQLVAPNPGEPAAFVLHYNDRIAHLPSNDALAIRMTKPDMLTPLFTPAYHAAQKRMIPAIKQHARTLEDGTYNRRELLLLKRHAPALALMDRHDQETLWRICSNNKKLNCESFDYVMSNLDKIYELYGTKYDPKRSKNVLLTREIYNIAANFRRQNDSPDDGKSHLLWELLKANQALVNELKFFSSRLKLTNRSFNALLHVYSAKGENGLKLLFSNWRDTDLKILSDLYKNDYSHLNSFDNLLQQDVQTTITKIISSFTTVQYAWWNALLQQHCAAVNTDSLPAMVNAFVEFLRLIEQQGLKLYTPVEFRDTHNMFVTMTRMLKILESAKSHRNAVWPTITALSFQSNTAIRAATEGKCRFVIPEMRCSAEAFYFDQDHASKGCKGYHTGFWNKANEDWHKIAVEPRFWNVNGKSYWKTINSGAFLTEPTHVELKKNFFRYLAFRELQYPVSFYRQALQLLDEKLSSVTNDALRSRMYCILTATLAASTTHAGLTAQNANPVIAMKQWGQILTNIITPSIPTTIKLAAMVAGKDPQSDIQEQYCQTLFSGTSLPALPVLSAILQESDKDIESLPVRKIQKKLAELENKLKVSTTVLDYFGGECLSRGRTFVGNNAGKISEYFNIGNLILHIDKDERNKYFNSNIASPEAQLFMSLISTFNLKGADNIRAIFTAWDAYTSGENKVYENLMLDMLNCLTKLQNNTKDRRTLQHNNLFTFLKDAFARILSSPDLLTLEKNSKEYQTLRLDHLGAWMSDYFPGALHEDDVRAIFYSSSEIESLETALNAAFIGEEPDVIAAVKEFAKPFAFDLNQHKDVIQDLKEIINSLLPLQKQKFLQLLTDHFSKPDSYADLKSLINIISTSSSPRAECAQFFYFCGRADAKDAPDLLKKVILFLQVIAPAQQSTKGISRFEAINLAAGLLLKEKQGALSIDTFSLLTQGAQLWSQIISALNAYRHQQTSLSNCLHTLTTLIARIDDDANVCPMLRAWVDLANMPRANINDYPLPDEVLAEAKAQISHKEKFSHTFLELLDQVSELSTLYPLIKKDLLFFVNHYISDYKDDNFINKAEYANEGLAPANAAHLSIITATWKRLETLKEAFHQIKDPEIISSLLYWYTRDGRTPDNLITLIFSIPDERAKVALLSLVAKLLDNGQKVSPEHLKKIIFSVNIELDLGQDTLLRSINTFYQTPPYPSLEKLDEWLTIQSPIKLKETRDRYDLKPFTRDTVINGFKLDKAIAQNELCLGYKFTDTDLDMLNIMTQTYSIMPMSELLDQFHSMRASARKKESVDYAKLVAIAAELLYRSKGMEINTTQYLSVLALVAGGKHVTAEIETGEGKSRIMMLVNACEFALGKTVDFVTSDLVLSRRDFQSSKAFFKIIGAESSMIYGNSPVSAYKIGGINFSDAANLSLFRNRARSRGQGHLVIAENPQDRVLVLDEGDKVYYDLADTKFNFSAEGDATIREMLWIYPVLIKFFMQPGAAGEVINQYYYNDIDRCNAEFFNFCRLHCTPKQMESLESLSMEQIETWQVSAMTAMKLQYGVHYNVKGDVVLNTREGPKVASEIRLIAHNREMLGAKFSNGVHQCLTAYLNLLKKNPDQRKLCHDILHFEHDFHEEAEKSIVCSSGAKDLLDDYAEGALKSVTGTAGSEIERMEASHLYGCQDSNPEPLRFISMPRHKGLHRIDLPPVMTVNQDQQVTLLLSAVREAVDNAQPILTICEDDKKSEELHALLLSRQGEFAISKDGGSFQRIHSQLSDEEEEKRVNAAGHAKQATTSTKMVGRGVDFELKEDTEKPLWEFSMDDEGVFKSLGLKVRPAFLASTRELRQLLGRSGRFSAKGDTQLILDKTNMPAEFDPHTYPLDIECRRLQVIMDRKSQCRRLIKNEVNDFMRDLRTRYLNVMGGNGKHEAWKEFSKHTNQAWLDIWPQIYNALKTQPLELDFIQAKLDVYHDKTAKLWKQLCLKLKHANPDLNLKSDVLPLKLGDFTTKLLTLTVQESFAPTLVELAVARCAKEGMLAGFEMFNFYFNSSKENQYDLGIAISQKCHGDFQPYLYTFMRDFAISAQQSMLHGVQRVVQACLDMPEPSEAAAKMVVQLIKEFILKNDWKLHRFHGSKVVSGNIKIPPAVHHLYELILQAATKPKPCYYLLLLDILKAAHEHKSSKDTTAIFDKLTTTKQFFYILNKVFNTVDVKELEVGYQKVYKK